MPTVSGNKTPGPLSYSITADVNIGATATSSAKLSFCGSLAPGYGCRHHQSNRAGEDVLSASVSGNTVFTIGNSGNVVMPIQTAASSITSTQTTTNILNLTDTALTSGRAIDISVNGNNVLTSGGGINITGLPELLPSVTIAVC